MTIPHWLAGLVIFASVAVLIGFAFRQGMRAKPGRDKILMNGCAQPGAALRQTAAI
jgi:hypothetical protein